MLIAQLSDPHIVAPGKLLYREIDTAAALTQAIARINALRPAVELVVISGDLANRGRIEEYEHLQSLLARLDAPCCLMPGNHDRRDHLRRVFAEQNFTGGALCCQRIDLDGLCLLLLDTTIPGAEGGAIDDARIAWLDAHCPPAMPTLLFLHHPPFATGIAGMDAIGLAGAERLEAWLTPRRNLIGIACGHVHRPVFSQFAGIPAMIAPSPAQQIALDLDGDPAALAWTPEPGGLLLHRWDGARLVSHVLPVEPAPVRTYG